VLFIVGCLDNLTNCLIIRDAFHIPSEKKLRYHLNSGESYLASTPFTKIGRSLSSSETGALRICAIVFEVDWNTVRMMAKKMGMRTNLGPTSRKAYRNLF
jgi:hypothetical protein